MPSHQDISFLPPEHSLARQGVNTIPASDLFLWSVARVCEEFDYLLTLEGKPPSLSCDRETSSLDQQQSREQETESVPKKWVNGDKEEEESATEANEEGNRVAPYAKGEAHSGALRAGEGGMAHRVERSRDRRRRSLRHEGYDLAPRREALAHHHSTRTKRAREHSPASTSSCVGSYVRQPLYRIHSPVALPTWMYAGSRGEESVLASHLEGTVRAVANQLCTRQAGYISFLPRELGGGKGYDKSTERKPAFMSVPRIPRVSEMPPRKACLAAATAMNSTLPPPSFGTGEREKTLPRAEERQRVTQSSVGLMGLENGSSLSVFHMKSTLLRFWLEHAPVFPSTMDMCGDVRRRAEVAEGMEATPPNHKDSATEGEGQEGLPSETVQQGWENKKPLATAFPSPPEREVCGTASEVTERETEIVCPLTPRDHIVEYALPFLPSLPSSKIGETGKKKMQEKEDAFLPPLAMTASGFTDFRHCRSSALALEGDGGDGIPLALHSLSTSLSPVSHSLPDTVTMTPSGEAHAMENAQFNDDRERGRVSPTKEEGRESPRLRIATVKELLHILKEEEAAVIISEEGQGVFQERARVDVSVLPPNKKNKKSIPQRDGSSDEDPLHSHHGTPSRFQVNRETSNRDAILTVEDQEDEHPRKKSKRKTQRRADSRHRFPPRRFQRASKDPRGLVPTKGAERSRGDRMTRTTEVEEKDWADLLPVRAKNAIASFVYHRWISRLDSEAAVSDAEEEEPKGEDFTRRTPPLPATAPSTPHDTGVQAEHTCASPTPSTASPSTGTHRIPTPPRISSPTQFRASPSVPVIDVELFTAGVGVVQCFSSPFSEGVLVFFLECIAEVLHITAFQALERKTNAMKVPQEKEGYEPHTAHPVDERRRESKKKEERVETNKKNKEQNNEEAPTSPVEEEWEGYHLCGAIEKLQDFFHPTPWMVSPSPPPSRVPSAVRLQASNLSFSSPSRSTGRGSRKERVSAVVGAVLPQERLWWWRSAVLPFLYLIPHLQWSSCPCLLRLSALLMALQNAHQQERVEGDNIEEGVTYASPGAMFSSSSHLSPPFSSSAPWNARPSSENHPTSLPFSFHPSPTSISPPFSGVSPWKAQEEKQCCSVESVEETASNKTERPVINREVVGGDWNGSPSGIGVLTYTKCYQLKATAMVKRHTTLAPPSMNEVKREEEVEVEDHAVYRRVSSPPLQGWGVSPAVGNAADVPREREARLPASLFLPQGLGEMREMEEIQEEERQALPRLPYYGLQGPSPALLVHHHHHHLFPISFPSFYQRRPHQVTASPSDAFDPSIFLSPADQVAFNAVELREGRPYFTGEIHHQEEHRQKIGKRKKRKRDDSSSVAQPSSLSKFRFSTAIARLPLADFAWCCSCGSGVGTKMPLSEMGCDGKGEGSAASPAASIPSSVKIVVRRTEVNVPFRILLSRHRCSQQHHDLPRLFSSQDLLVPSPGPSVAQQKEITKEEERTGSSLRNKEDPKRRSRRTGRPEIHRSWDTMGEHEWARAARLAQGSAAMHPPSSTSLPALSSTPGSSHPMKKSMRSAPTIQGNHCSSLAFTSTGATSPAPASPSLPHTATTMTSPKTTPQKSTTTYLPPTRPSTATLTTGANEGLSHSFSTGNQLGKHGKALPRVCRTPLQKKKKEELHSADGKAGPPPSSPDEDEDTEVEAMDWLPPLCISHPGVWAYYVPHTAMDSIVAVVGASSTVTSETSSSAGGTPENQPALVLDASIEMTVSRALDIRWWTEVRDALVVASVRVAGGLQEAMATLQQQVAPFRECLVGECYPSSSPLGSGSSSTTSSPHDVWDGRKARPSDLPIDTTLPTSLCQSSPVGQDGVFPSSPPTLADSGEEGERLSIGTFGTPADSSGRNHDDAEKKTEEKRKAEKNRKEVAGMERIRTAAHWRSYIRWVVPDRDIQQAVRCPFSLVPVVRAVLLVLAHFRNPFHEMPSLPHSSKEIQETETAMGDTSDTEKMVWFTSYWQDILRLVSRGVSDLRAVVHAGPSSNAPTTSTPHTGAAIHISPSSFTHSCRVPRRPQGVVSGPTLPSRRCPSPLYEASDGASSIASTSAWRVPLTKCVGAPSSTSSVGTLFSPFWTVADAPMEMAELWMQYVDPGAFSELPTSELVRTVLAFFSEPDISVEMLQAAFQHRGRFIQSTYLFLGLVKTTVGTLMVGENEKRRAIARVKGRAEDKNVLQGEAGDMKRSCSQERKAYPLRSDRRTRREEVAAATAGKRINRRSWCMKIGFDTASYLGLISKLFAVDFLGVYQCFGLEGGGAPDADSTKRNSFTTSTPAPGRSPIKRTERRPREVTADWEHSRSPPSLRGAACPLPTTPPTTRTTGGGVMGLSHQRHTGNNDWLFAGMKGCRPTTIHTLRECVDHVIVELFSTLKHLLFMEHQKAFSSFSPFSLLSSSTPQHTSLGVSSLSSVGSYEAQPPSSTMVGASSLHSHPSPPLSETFLFNVWPFGPFAFLTLSLLIYVATSVEASSRLPLCLPDICQALLPFSLSHSWTSTTANNKEVSAEGGAEGAAKPLLKQQNEIRLDVEEKETIEVEKKEREDDNGKPSSTYFSSPSPHFSNNTQYGVPFSSSLPQSAETHLPDPAVMPSKVWTSEVHPGTASRSSSFPIPSLSVNRLSIFQCNALKGYHFLELTRQLPKDALPHPPLLLRGLTAVSSSLYWARPPLEMQRAREPPRKNVTGHCPHPIFIPHEMNLLLPREITVIHVRDWRNFRFGLAGAAPRVDMDSTVHVCWNSIGAQYFANGLICVGDGTSTHDGCPYVALPPLQSGDALTIRFAACVSGHDVEGGGGERGGGYYVHWYLNEVEIAVLPLPVNTPVWIAMTYSFAAQAPPNAREGHVGKHEAGPHTSMGMRFFHPYSEYVEHVGHAWKRDRSPSSLSDTSSCCSSSPLFWCYIRFPQGAVEGDLTDDGIRKTNRRGRSELPSRLHFPFFPSIPRILYNTSFLRSLASSSSFIPSPALLPNESLTYPCRFAPAIVPSFISLYRVQGFLMLSLEHAFHHLCANRLLDNGSDGNSSDHDRCESSVSPYPVKRNVACSEPLPSAHASSSSTFYTTSGVNLETTHPSTTSPLPIALKGGRTEPLLFGKDPSTFKGFLMSSFSLSLFKHLRDFLGTIEEDTNHSIVHEEWEETPRRRRALHAVHTSKDTPVLHTPPFSFSFPSLLDGSEKLSPRLQEYYLCNKIIATYTTLAAVTLGHSPLRACEDLAEEIMKLLTHYQPMLLKEVQTILLSALNRIVRLHSGALRCHKELLDQLWHLCWEGGFPSERTGPHGADEGDLLFRKGGDARRSPFISSATPTRFVFGNGGLSNLLQIDPLGTTLEGKVSSDASQSAREVLLGFATEGITFLSSPLDSNEGDANDLHCKPGCNAARKGSIKLEKERGEDKVVEFSVQFFFQDSENEKLEVPYSEVGVSMTSPPPPRTIARSLRNISMEDRSILSLGHTVLRGEGRSPPTCGRKEPKEDKFISFLPTSTSSEPLSSFSLFVHPSDALFPLHHSAAGKRMASTVVPASRTESCNTTRTASDEDGASRRCTSPDDSARHFFEPNADSFFLCGVPSRKDSLPLWSPSLRRHFLGAVISEDESGGFSWSRGVSNRIDLEEGSSRPYTVWSEHGMRRDGGRPLGRDFFSGIRRPASEVDVREAVYERTRIGALEAAARTRTLLQYEENWRFPMNGVLFGSGDVMTVRVHRVHRTVSFFRNGRPLGNIFTIPLTCQKVYPYVLLTSLHTRVQWRHSFLQEHTLLSRQVMRAALQCWTSALLPKLKHMILEHACDTGDTTGLVLLGADGDDQHARVHTPPNPEDGSKKVSSVPYGTPSPYMVQPSASPLPYRSKAFSSSPAEMCRLIRFDAPSSIVVRSVGNAGADTAVSPFQLSPHYMGAGSFSPELPFQEVTSEVFQALFRLLLWEGEPQGTNVRPGVLLLSGYSGISRGGGRMCTEVIYHGNELHDDATGRSRRSERRTLETTPSGNGCPNLHSSNMDTKRKIRLRQCHIILRLLRLIAEQPPALLLEKAKPQLLQLLPLLHCLIRCLSPLLANETREDDILLGFTEVERQACIHAELVLSSSFNSFGASFTTAHADEPLSSLQERKEKPTTAEVRQESTQQSIPVTFSLRKSFSHGIEEGCEDTVTYEGESPSPRSYKAEVRTGLNHFKTKNPKEEEESERSFTEALTSSKPTATARISSPMSPFSFLPLCLSCLKPWNECTDKHHAVPLTNCELVHMLLQAVGEDSSYTGICGRWEGHSRMFLEISKQNDEATEVSDLPLPSSALHEEEEMCTALPLLQEMSLSDFIKGEGACTHGTFRIEAHMDSSISFSGTIIFDVRTSPREEKEQAQLLHFHREWACEACTFLNEGGTTHCSMCLTERRGMVWTCQVCSNASNPINISTCSRCGRYREDAATRANLSRKTCYCRECGASHPYNTFVTLRLWRVCPSCNDLTEWIPDVLHKGDVKGVLLSEGDALLVRYVVDGNSFNMVHMMTSNYSLELLKKELASKDALSKLVQKAEILKQVVDTSNTKKKEEEEEEGEGSLQSSSSPKESARLLAPLFSWFAKSRQPLLSDYFFGKPSASENDPGRDSSSDSDSRSDSDNTKHALSIFTNLHGSIPLFSPSTVVSGGSNLTFQLGSFLPSPRTLGFDDNPSSPSAPSLESEAVYASNAPLRNDSIGILGNLKNILFGIFYFANYLVMRYTPTLAPEAFACPNLIACFRVFNKSWLHSLSALRKVDAAALLCECLRLFSMRHSPCLHHKALESLNCISQEVLRLHDELHPLQSYLLYYLSSFSILPYTHHAAMEGMNHLLESYTMQQMVPFFSTCATTAPTRPLPPLNARCLTPLIFSFPSPSKEELQLAIFASLHGISNLGRASRDLLVLAISCLIYIIHNMEKAAPLPRLLDHQGSATAVFVYSIPLSKSELTRENLLLVGQLRGSRGLVPAMGGKWYYEIVLPPHGLNEKRQVFCGWGTLQHEQERSRHHVGNDMYSWGYNCKDKVRLLGTDQVNPPPRRLPAGGDVIGALLDLETMMMTWSINGETLTWICVPYQKEGEALYPYVSSSRTDGICVRLTHTQYCPSGFHDFTPTNDQIEEYRKPSNAEPQPYSFYKELLHFTEEADVHDFHLSSAGRSFLNSKRVQQLLPRYPLVMEVVMGLNSGKRTGSETEPHMRCVSDMVGVNVEGVSAGMDPSAEDLRQEGNVQQRINTDRSLDHTLPSPSLPHTDDPYLDVTVLTPYMAHLDGIRELTVIAARDMDIIQASSVFQHYFTMAQNLLLEPGRWSLFEITSGKRPNHNCIPARVLINLEGSLMALDRDAFMSSSPFLLPSSNDDTESTSSASYSSGTPILHFSDDSDSFSRSSDSSTSSGTDSGTGYAPFFENGEDEEGQEAYVGGPTVLFRHSPSMNSSLIRVLLRNTVFASGIHADRVGIMSPIANDSRSERRTDHMQRMGRRWMAWSADVESGVMEGDDEAHITVEQSSRVLSITEQVFQQIEKLDIYSNTVMFNVSIVGDVVLDNGGVTRSILSEISKELNYRVVNNERVDPVVPLFKLCRHSSVFTILPNVEEFILRPDSTEEKRTLFHRMLVWLGKLMGNITLCGSLKLPLLFPRLVWKFLSFKEPTIEDYYHDIDDSIAHVIQNPEMLQETDIRDLVHGVLVYPPPPSTFPCSPCTTGGNGKEEGEVATGVDSAFPFPVWTLATPHYPTTPDGCTQRHGGEEGCREYGSSSILSSSFLQSSTCPSSVENGTPLYAAALAVPRSPSHLLDRDPHKGGVQPGFPFSSFSDHRSQEEDNTPNMEVSYSERNLRRSLEECDAAASVASYKAQVEYALLHQYDAALLSLRIGLTSVISECSLKSIRWDDLQKRICGTFTLRSDDILAFMNCSALPSQLQKNLQEVLESMTEAELRQFILFCSGQTCLPLPGEIRVTCGDDPSRMPTSHTCFPISLQLQPYKDVHTMAEMIRMSLAHATQYGLA